MPKWRKLAKGFELHAQSTVWRGQNGNQTARQRRKRRQRQRLRLSVAPHAPPPLAGQGTDMQICRRNQIKSAHVPRRQSPRCRCCCPCQTLSCFPCLPTAPSIPIRSLFLHSHMSQILDANLRVFINFNFNLAKSACEFYFELCLSKLLLFS